MPFYSSIMNDASYSLPFMQIIKVYSPVCNISKQRDCVSSFLMSMLPEMIISPFPFSMKYGMLERFAFPLKCKKCPSFSTSGKGI